MLAVAAWRRVGAAYRLLAVVSIAIVTVSAPLLGVVAVQWALWQWVA